MFAGIMHAELTRADAFIGTFLAIHDGLFTASLEALASREQQREWLPDAYSLRTTGAFALTEPQGGSDIAGGLRTTATRDGGNWVLQGAKRWIGNATFCEQVLVFARDTDDGEVKGFLVHTALEGYSATLIEGKGRCAASRTRTSRWRRSWFRRAAGSPGQTVSEM